MNPNDAEESLSVESLVSQVTDEYMLRLDRGERPDSEDFARRYPQIAGVLRQVLPALGALRSPIPVLVPPPEVVCSPALPGGGPLGDYRILREIGRGGMGVVYEAEQISLGRQVALKILPLAAALDARALQRFKNEARAAAQLHHPNIVPVIGIGCERGVHYYAMQYIEGQNLATLIETLQQSANHKDPEAATSINALRSNARQRPASLRSGEVPPTIEGPVQCSDRIALLPPRLAVGKPAVLGAATTELSTSSPAYLRTIVRLALQAAQALDYAHSVGVLHRDIKPGNLMIDGRSNLWITDFGLAQIRSDPRLTASGDLMGTLRYMSPEQALGKPGAVDHRSDIYSLGATLYELLTLKPLCTGEQKEELLWQIGSEEPVSPRRLNPAIPNELATIVLNAIAKNPAERYASAQELATDLDRFLKDKPIRARPPTLEQRLARWCRRHRPIVWSVGISSVVVLLLTVGVLAVSYHKIQGALARVQSEQEKTAAAHRLEAEQRQRAEANLELVIRALDETGLRTAELLLPQDPLAVQQQVDRGLFRRVLPLYEQLAQVNGAEPGVRLTRGRAYRRLGMIQQELGQPADADRAYGEAITILRQLAEESPPSRELTYELVHSYWGQGQTLRALQRPMEAETAYHHGLALCQHGLTTTPSDPQRQSELAGMRHNLATLAADRGSMSRAIELLQQAIQGQQGAAAADPPLETYRERLGAHFLALGFCLNKAGQSFQACAAYRDGIRTFEELATGSRSFLPYQARVALGLSRLAGILDDQSQLGEAESTFRQSIALYEKLVAASPGWHAYTIQLNLRHLDLANVLLRKGNATEALRSIEQARRREVVGTRDEVLATALASSVSLYFSNLGDLLARAGQPAKAEESLRTALQYYTQSTPSGGSPAQRLHFAMIHHRLGIALHEQNRPNEAEPLYTQAIDSLRALATEFPEVAEYRYRLGRSLRNLATVQSTRREFRRAQELLEEALRLHEALRAQDPAHTLYRHSLGLAWSDLAEVRARDGDRSAAEQHYEKARRLQETLVAERPSLLSYRRQLARTLHAHASLLRTWKRPAEALPLVEEAIRQQEQVAAMQPAHRPYRVTLLSYHATLTALLVELRKPADAVVALRREMTVRQKLLTDSAVEADFEHQQYNACARLGSMLRDLQRPSEAEQAFRQALTLVEQLLVKQPTPTLSAAREQTLGRLAEVLLKQERLAEAREALEEAVKGKDLARVTPNTVEYRLLRTHYALLITVLLQLEEHQQAAAAVENQVLLAPTGVEEIYRSTVAVIKCMHLAETDKRLSVNDRLPTMERYAVRARQLLDELSRRAKHSPAARNELAWFLLTCSVPRLRDVDEATRLAREAVAGAPNEANYWNTLALACYRTEAWQEGQQAIERAIELHRGRDAFDGLVQAMLDWQVERKQAARGWLQWTHYLLRTKPATDPILLALRAEAERLIQGNDQRDVREAASK